MPVFLFYLLMLLPISTVLAAEPLSIPAFTAYSEPNPDGVDFSKSGITGWKSADTRISWYGQLNNTGKLKIAVVLRLPLGARSSLQLKVGNRKMKAEAIGKGDEPVTISFGQVDIFKAGSQSFTLTGLSKTGASFGEIESLLLDGAPVTGAKFNMVERKNTASVHIFYPAPENEKITGFYTEVTGKTDPIWTYYMACGFNRGYFGIQVNSPTERRIIFSIWDSGNEGVDRSKVSADDRVKLLKKGEGVVAGDFGNEGTGGHSHLIYPWKTGQTYRLYVSVKPEGNATIYTGWFYFPEKKSWGLIASFKAPKDGNYLRGLYSFDENFGGDNGQLRRLAEFGNQWIHTANGDWKELLTARFSHDGHGDHNRTDYGMGATGNKFFLATGGYIFQPVKAGDPFQRTPTGKHPDVPSSIDRSD